MSLEPQTVSEALSVTENVTDRLAIRLMYTAIYGVGVHEFRMASVRRQWKQALTDEDREVWRVAAGQVLADIALGDQSEMYAFREYEVRHPEHGTHGPLDDIGDTVDFSDHVWPGSKVFERTCVTVRSEWTEVTA